MTTSLRTISSSDLQVILEDHRLWISSGGTQGKRANLSFVNLSGADLRDANLYCADLSGADLRDADLSEADLSGAYLHGANLRDANLYGANLTDADLEGADFSGAKVSESWKIVDGKLVMISAIGEKEAQSIVTRHDCCNGSSVTFLEKLAAYNKVTALLDGLATADRDDILKAVSGKYSSTVSNKT